MLGALDHQKLGMIVGAGTEHGGDGRVTLIPLGRKHPARAFAKRRGESREIRVLENGLQGLRHTVSLFLRRPQSSR